MCCRRPRKRGHSSRTRGGSRPTPRWASAGCAGGGRGPCALRGSTARHGLAGRSTSIRGASIGCPGGARTGSFSSSCSTICGGLTAATKRELHLATDNDGSHTSKRVRRYVEDSGGRIRLYPLPSWSPESNPVEVVWWSLHEAVSRNHECAGLDDLVELAEGYLEEGQPFRLKLGEVYDRLERPPP